MALNWCFGGAKQLSRRTHKHLVTCFNCCWIYAKALALAKADNIPLYLRQLNALYIETLSWINALHYQRMLHATCGSYSHTYYSVYRKPKNHTATFGEQQMNCLITPNLDSLHLSHCYWLGGGLAMTSDRGWCSCDKFFIFFELIWGIFIHIRTILERFYSSRFLSFW